MGGTQSNNIEVEEIRKSKKSSPSPQLKNSKLSRTPSKIAYASPSPKKKDFDTTNVHDLKKSSIDANHSLTENTAESRTKKKIKSVKVLPPAFGRVNVSEDPQELRSSGEKVKESQIRNEKQEMHRLMRVYDLV